MDKKTVIICLVVGFLIGIAVPILVNSYERPRTNNIMEEEIKMADNIMDKECLVNLTIRELELAWRSFDRFTKSAEYNKCSQTTKDNFVKLIEKIEVLLVREGVLK